MHEDVDGSNSLLHTSPGELRGWYDVCILVCTPCCGGAMCVSQRLSLFLRVSSACGWEPRTHFEKSTTCLTRVYTKNAGGELETSENESSESMTASQEELSCLRVGDNPSTSRQREISSESSGRNERGEEGPKPLQPQEAAAAGPKPLQPREAAAAGPEPLQPREAAAAPLKEVPPQARMRYRQSAEPCLPSRVRWPSRVRTSPVPSPALLSPSEAPAPSP